MNKLKNKSLFFLVLLMLSTNIYAQKLKIAYIGNSITQIHHIPFYDPGYEGYSDFSALLLSEYFGQVADVQNYGNGGKTLVEKIDPSTGKLYDGSYMQTNEFKNALKFAPDICFISLGTNDGTTSSWPDTPGNRGYVTDFYDDYLSMVDSFKVRNPNTHFILCYPPPIFGVNLVYDDAMAIKMRPEIDKVIAHLGTDSLDWHTLLKDKAALYNADRIHPKVEGCALMGKFAFEKIVSTGLLDGSMSKSSLILNKPVAVSSSIGSNDGLKAVDLDQNSYWEANFSESQWISAELGRSYDTKMVRLVWAESQSKDFSIQVSDNNTDWTTIKSVSGDTSRIHVSMNLTGTGKYVRVLLTNLNGASFKLKEFEVFGTLHMAGVNITALGGRASAQNTSAAAEGPEMAFDQLADTKFKTNYKNTWLEFKAKGQYSLNGYTVTSGNDGASNDPIKWILEGSKDDNIWAPIDSVGFDKNIVFNQIYEKKYYQVSDTTQYAFFRLNLTSASTKVHIGELELFGDYKSAVLPNFSVLLTSNPVSYSSKLIGARSYFVNGMVQIIAGKGSGYYFTGWTGTIADVALLDNPLADTATFIMPSRNVTLKANYSRITNDLQSTESSLIKLYPNPVKSILNIAGLSSKAVVSIYNTSGVKLNIKTGSEINVAGLTKGMYIVSIYTPEGVINKTFLKE